MPVVASAGVDTGPVVSGVANSGRGEMTARGWGTHRQAVAATGLTHIGRLCGHNPDRGYKRLREDGGGL